MFDKFKSMLNMSDKKSVSKSADTATLSNRAVYTGSTYHGAWSYDFAKGRAYDNVYPSISKIANAFMLIRPYAIDENGEPIEKALAVDKLYHPNQQMSSVVFREALAIETLTHRKTLLLVWHKEDGKIVAGGRTPITPDNIAGFTFLENAFVDVRNDVKYYKTSDLRYEFSENHVIEIMGGLDPDDLLSGYSPTQAVQKWANIDDFIAAYEGGLFENNAVPAGQFVITAPSVSAFNDAVDMMQSKFRGSGNNNNVSYIHRPISANGQAQPAMVEWIPFSMQNRDMSLETIFKQVNNKIDSTFGVPASIRGVNENKGYASVRIDEQVFNKYTINPLALKIWTTITHELNRITGGLGYAITYDLEIPNIAEEEKTDAERKKVEADIIHSFLDKGYSLDSIVDAFELSNAYKLLKFGEGDDGEIVNDKPDVDTGEEVDESPKVGVVKSVAKHCTHNHDVVHKEADPKTLKALRQLLNDYLEDEIDATIDGIKNAGKAISAVGLEIYDENQDGLIDEQEAMQLPVPEPDEAKKYALVAALLALLFRRMEDSGEKRYQETILQFGITINVPDLAHYVISDDAKKRYENMVNDIVNSYTEQITDSIRRAINSAVENGDGKTSVKDVIRSIQNVFETDQYKVDRIANTEEHRADNLGQVDAVGVLQKVSGREFGFKWRTTSGDPCEFCQYMNGTIVATGEAFVPLGEKIQLDDSIYLNDYEDMLTPNAHPNCQCVFDVVEL